MTELQTLLDHHEISQLMGNYNFGLDLKDVERFLAVWTEDAVWDFGETFGAFKGLDEILRTFELFHSLLDEIHHLTSDVVVEVTGDSATGLSHSYAQARFVDGHEHRLIARNRDTYRRVDGQWRMSERRIEMFPPFAL